MFLLDDPKVERFLRAWFSGMGFQWGQYRHYHDLKNLQEYKEYIKNCYLAGKPAFHSVSPNRRIYRIFWEFDIKKEQLEEMGLDIRTVKLTYDSPHLDFLWEQAVNLALNIVSNGGKPLLLYSGNKGFHCWVYSHTRPFTYGPDGVPSASLLYKTILHGVMGDKKQYPNWDTAPTSFNSMARIPFSFHQKTGNQVIPLKLDRVPYIPQLDDFMLNPIDKEILNKLFSESGDILKNRKDQQKLRASQPSKYGNWGDVRKCIKDAMEKNPDHFVRLAYVMDAIYAEFTDEQIHDGFSQLCGDYDYDKTQYQIEHARESKEEGVLPFSKESLIRFGIMKEMPKGWGR